MTTNYLEYCKVCRNYYDYTYLLSCDCGLKMCKSCWLEYDYVCPMCEADHRPATSEK